MLKLIIPCIVCNAYIIYVILLMLFAPRRPLDKNGKVIYEKRK